MPQQEEKKPGLINAKVKPRLDIELRKKGKKTQGLHKRVLAYSQNV